MTAYVLTYDGEIEADSPEQAAATLAAIMRQQIITSWRVTGKGRGSGRGAVLVQIVDGRGEVIPK